MQLGSAKELAAVIDKVAAGDRSAFETLYRATSAKLYGVIVRIILNRSAADEILQEVYVRIWQHAHEFQDNKASPITWMAAIARNRAIDELRRSKTGTVETIDDSADLPGENPHPLDGQARSDDLRALLECLNRLDAEKRKIILLAYYRGLSREELARRFDKPVPTVKTWLHRGLAQLKTCLNS